eukprot:g13076.t1
MAVDIITLQEVQKDAYDEWFRPQLLDAGYEGVFQQKKRDRTMIQSSIVGSTQQKAVRLFTKLLDSAELTSRSSTTTVKHPLKFEILVMTKGVFKGYPKESCK